MIAPQVAGEWCDDLDRALRGSEMNLAGVAHRIVVVIQEEAWRERCVRTGEIMKCASFLDLLTSPPLKGFGEDVKRVESLLRDDPEALRLFRDATVAPNHRPAKAEGEDGSSDIITTKPERGTARSYTLTRLHKQHPELYARVVAGELSANAAAIQAGYRRTFTPLERMVKWWHAAKEEERAQFLAQIGVSR